MSVSAVQHKSLFQSSSTAVLSFTSSVTAGNLLAYFTMSDGAPSAATDNNSNTIANATSVANGSSGAVRADYVASANSGATQATGTRGGSTGGVHFHIWEVSGCATSTPVRDTGTVTSSATFSVSTVGSTSQTGDAVLGAFNDFLNNDPLAAGTGFTPSEETPDSSFGDAALSEFKAATVSGTQTATGSGNGTSALQQVIVVFKQAASGPTVGEMMAARQCGQDQPVFDKTGVVSY